MGPIGFIILFFTLSYISAKRAFVTVQCKTEQVGQYGQNSMLQCLVKTSEDVKDPEISMVTWKKLGTEESVLSYSYGNLKVLPRFSFAVSSWDKRNMNVSLLITDTDINDEDSYTCQVLVSAGFDTGKTHLKVTAKYKTPNVTIKSDDIKHGTLRCNTDGGYPKGQLRWFDEQKTELKPSGEMEATQTESGLFQLSSRLALLNGSTFSEYSCVVFSASGDREDEKNLTIQYMPKKEDQAQSDKRKGLDPNINVVAALVVIGSLIVGLLLLLLYAKRRRHHVNRGNHQGINTNDYSLDAGALEKMDKSQDRRED